MKHLEEQEQASLFQWAELESKKYPQLRFMYAIPNGGYRKASEAARLKASGVKAGVPDICLPAPIGGYSGLYIELKVGANRPTKLQKEWLTGLAKLGYCATVCVGFEDARATITRYLEGGHWYENKNHKADQ